MAIDSEAQEDELLALESIFENEDIFSRETVLESESESRSGCLKVSPKITDHPINFSCKFRPKTEDLDVAGSSKGVNSTEKISYLPPVVLNFVLPHDYPSKSPPKLTLTCKWLDRVLLSKIGSKLDDIWLEQEGQEVLYTWVQFLQEDALKFLDLSDGIEISQEEYDERKQLKDLDVRVAQDVQGFSDILPIVLEYDEQQKQKLYDSTPFECNVCFTEKYGKNCIQFKDCGHVYCKECIKSYFDLQIKEGNMKSLLCPEPECESQAYPAQIKNLVSAKDFERYETLLLQTTLDTMKDITYCPRKFCQSPVLLEPEETIGICPACRFSFCPFCKLSYHGVEPCKSKQSALINKGMYEEYENGDGQTKKELEWIWREGVKDMPTTLQNFESEKWISDNTRNCPGCNASIEKIDGCNAMVCSKCECYFCWLCLKKLMPYYDNHFRNSESKCDL